MKDEKAKDIGLRTNPLLDYTERLAKVSFAKGNLAAMRTLAIVVIALLVLAGAVAAGYQPAMDYWQRQNMPEWRTAEVEQGEIVSVVNSTGTIKPVLQVSVGSFVSGPIDATYHLKDRNGDCLVDRQGLPLTLSE